MKQWYESKTIWFNAIMNIAVTIIYALGIVEPMTAILTCAITMSNAFLRTITEFPIDYGK